MEEVTVTPQKKRRDAIRDKLEFESAYHPGVDAKNLIHLVHSTVVNGVFTPDLHYASWDKETILCRNCGLTDIHAAMGYTSRIKLYYLKHNNAIWELGGPDG
ncbi:hypothetical protein sscle_07g057370 [Sclerotinia sclerotiorum 1980 UF-70]|uniref:Uncharacterized protein n=1 Tax=Sclerotinia sclerotiorum (strain ATCC 18683 / 1980 / Ss-1) TaxID=665079 RepID=A0A1D9Q7R4_SCLS1|nr:hypothetical protein sscle_07g057370 [Sclerotinia sclerotiorum 1980 UF-70]